MAALAPAFVGGAFAVATAAVGELQPGTRPARMSVGAALSRDINLVLEDRVELPRLYLAWHSPAMFASGDADLDLAADLLANGAARTASFDQARDRKDDIIQALRLTPRWRTQPRSIVLHLPWYLSPTGQILGSATLASAARITDRDISLCYAEAITHIKNRAFLFDHTSKDQTTYGSRRRSVYLPVIRNHLYDVFQLFDSTDATVSNGDRAKFNSHELGGHIGSLTFYPGIAPPRATYDELSGSGLLNEIGSASVRASFSFELGEANLKQDVAESLLVISRPKSGQSVVHRSSAAGHERKLE